MSYKDLLVVLDAGAPARGRIELPRRSRSVSRRILSGSTRCRSRHARSVLRRGAGTGTRCRRQGWRRLSAPICWLWAPTAILPRELLLGGAARTLLRSMTPPVLMSH
jgi:hypothetical protein